MEPAGSKQARRAWRIVPAVVFGGITAVLLRDAILHPTSIGLHAVIYSDAARAMVSGRNPWIVGPPGAIFAGPPPMLLPFVPFIGLPQTLVRVIWVAGTALLALDSVRRLGLPAWWIAFPPLAAAIIMGHPEPIVLWLLVQRSPLSGLAPMIKPYAILPLIGSGRRAALVLAAALLVVTLPLLPWQLFIQQLPQILATLARQSHGDSAFGNPVAMILAAASLAVIGWRRALWLATPVLLPNTQPGYKISAMPACSPILATCWAVPIPGMTLAGVLIEAVLTAADRRWRLPAIISAALERTPLAHQVTEPSTGRGPLVDPLATTA